MERKINNTSSLQSLIEEFIEQGLETRRFTINRGTRYHVHLIGSPSSLTPLSYIRFLKAIGIANPQMDALNATYIGRYWEFVTQYHGTLASEKAMTALRVFWIWAKANGYIKSQTRPADLASYMKVMKPYRLKIKISETK